MTMYSITLWDALKFEILQVQEEDLADASLIVLAAISRNLTQGSRDGFLAYLKPIVKECNEHLEDAPTKQSDAAIRILFAIAASTAEASNYIMAGVLPHLLVLYQATDSVSKRRSLIQALGRVLEASILVFGDWRSTPTQTAEKKNISTLIYGRASENSLHQSGHQVLEVLASALSSVPVKEVSYRLVILDSLLQLTKSREILGDDDIARVLRLINDVLLQEESYGKDDMKTAAVDTLVEIAHQKSQLVIDSCFPAFLARLPDTDVGFSGKYIPVLEAFAKLGAEEKVFGTVVLRIKNKLLVAIHQAASPQYIQSLLSALLFAFTHSPAPLEGRDDFCPYFTDLLLPLWSSISNDMPFNQQDECHPPKADINLSEDSRSAALLHI
jgi:DNA repair/transcription protein MET18/MMS19